ncbi:MAG TPA: DNA polymerase I [Deltaproteobacteria bacterium]|nr:DNA polymerase I [Deltaproteobacteria bacterium]
MTAAKEVFLVDGSSYVYRAFYAMRNLSTSAGLPTNAVYILARMLLKLIRDKDPAYLCFVLDSRGPTERHARYQAYKATRQKMPEALSVQFPYILDMVRAFGIPVLRKEGVEADDIIATAARRFRSDAKVYIISGDKDLMQLVDDSVLVWDTLKDQVYDKEAVKARYGVYPEYMADLLAVMGDSSDNIPGVPGIGAKGALELVNTLGHVQDIIAGASTIEAKRAREAILNNTDKALLSLDLVRLDRDVDLRLDYPDIARGPMDKEGLVRLFTELEFRALASELAAQAPEAAPSFSGAIEHACNPPLSGETGLFVLEGECSAASSGGTAFVCLEKDACLDVLTNGRCRLVMHDAKESLVAARRRGVAVKAEIFDTMLAAYCCDAATGQTTLEDLAKAYLDRDLKRARDLMGTGRKALRPGEIDPEELSRFLAGHAACLAPLQHELSARMADLGVDRLFHELEIPLMHVLADMEAVGVLVDAELLGTISAEIEAQLAGMEERVYALAGRPFNINSPKQLGEILFVEMKLPAVKKTKTGFSTDSAVLEALAARHELPAMILDWRMLTKLKNTYVDTLPAMIDPETGRVHTRFNQAVTATGRISSSEPNLQNIPIRTDMGRRIREAFRAPEGFTILSADYSQIELRILAHITKDPVLTESFEKGLDIHARTAAEVFGVGLGEVTEGLRRQAKTINFGIMYGMGPHKLSSELGIRRDTARQYIDTYLARYPGVSAYMEGIARSAEQDGFVTTVMGRRRSIPEIASPNFNEREGARRIAINTPIQGSAADIIKLAMVRIHERMKGMQSRMILQVHDELVFEVVPDELEQVRTLVKHEMENAFPLHVPVHVDIGTGKSWAEAH